MQIRIVLIVATMAALLISCQRMASKQVIPESIKYHSREAWGAKPPVLPMRSHTLTRLTIHHTATRQLPEKSLVDKMRGLQKFSQAESPLADGRMKPAWADIPYHLYVDVNGEVAQGRDIAYAGDSNTAYDPAGHLLVVVEGNFEDEELTPKQMETLKLLVPALAKRYKIPADSIATHKDFAQTACPGKKLYAEVGQLQHLVRKQAK